MDLFYIMNRIVKEKQIWQQVCYYIITIDLNPSGNIDTHVICINILILKICLTNKN